MFGTGRRGRRPLRCQIVGRCLVAAVANKIKFYIVGAIHESPENAECRVQMKCRVKSAECRVEFVGVDVLGDLLQA